MADGLGVGKGGGSGQMKGFEHSAQNEDLGVPLNVNRTAQIWLRRRPCPFQG